MEDGLELFAFLGVAEDFGAEVFPYEGAGFGIEDGVSEKGGELGEDFGFFEEGFDGLVAIEDDDVWQELAEEVDGGGFAGGDAAGEREGEHVRSFNFQVPGFNVQTWGKGREGARAVRSSGLQRLSPKARLDTPGTTLFRKRELLSTPKG